MERQWRADTKGTCFNSRYQFNQTRIFNIFNRCLVMVGSLVGLTVCDWLLVVLYLSSSMLSLHLLPFTVLLHPSFNLILFVSLVLCQTLALLICWGVVFWIFNDSSLFSAIIDSNVTTRCELKYFFCRFRKNSLNLSCFPGEQTGSSLEKCQPLTFTRFDQNGYFHSDFSSRFR